MDELLGKLDASSQKVETLRSEFTQKNRLKLFRQELQSEGRLLYRRPRQIRWEYLKPDPSTLILDDKLATLSTVGAAPQTFDLDRDPTMRIVFDQLLVWLGAGPKDRKQLEADYTLGATEQKGDPALVLTPRPESPVAKMFTRIELRLDKKTTLMKALLLVEKSGDEKEIVFSHVVQNGALPSDAFAPGKK